MHIATPDGLRLQFRFQADYCKQFHKTYADPAKLDAVVKETKVDDWVKLFQTKCSNVTGTPINGRLARTSTCRPSRPGALTTPSGHQGPTKAQRNPYYWKVDTAGNQLPYIDGIIYDYVEDAQGAGAEGD